MAGNGVWILVVVEDLFTNRFSSIVVAGNILNIARKIIFLKNYW